MRFLFALLSRSSRLWPALLALVFLLVGSGSVFAALAAPSASIATLSNVRSVSIAKPPEYPSGPVRGGSVIAQQSEYPAGPI